LKYRYERGEVGDIEVKQKLAKALNEFLEPIRKKRKGFESQKGFVEKILEEGTKKAKVEAGETLRMVKTAMKIDYFS